MFKLNAADIVIIALGVYLGFILIEATKNIVEENRLSLEEYSLHK